MQRLLIALYAIWRNLAGRFRPPRQGRPERVLILFQQVFGDAVILSSALQGYINLFVRQKGMKATLLCKPAIAKFLSEVVPVPEGIEVETMDFKRSFDDFRYFKEQSRKYRRYADIVIVPGSSLSAELLSSTLIAQRRIGLTNVIRRKWPPQLVVFERLAYTEPVVPDFGTMMIQRHRILLNYLGLKEYKGKLPTLKKQERMIEGNYCVLCPGASTSVKRWPIERFVEVADWLIEQRGWDVHLCGGAEEISTAEELISLSKYSDRIVNHVGKTTFSEWSSIIEYAQMAIGNDSATLHIAAGHRVPSVCITGIYDKYQFFPYLVDELDEGDSLPETAFVDMPCEYCRTKGYFAGYGNPICQQALKAGKCTLCIDAITVDMMKEKIESFIIS